MSTSPFSFIQSVTAKPIWPPKSALPPHRESICPTRDYMLQTHLYLGRIMLVVLVKEIWIKWWASLRRWNIKNQCSRLPVSALTCKETGYHYFNYKTNNNNKNWMHWKSIIWVGPIRELRCRTDSHPKMWRERWLDKITAKICVWKFWSHKL